jgi:hypothetical protein
MGRRPESVGDGSPTMTADEAVRLIEPVDRVYPHEVAMTPHGLVEALVRRTAELTGVGTVSLRTEGPTPQVALGLAGRIRHNALFVGANVREAVNDGRADYTPSSSPRCRPSSPTALCRSTWRCSRSRRPTATASAASAPRSRAPGPPPTLPGGSSRWSTRGCP